MVYRQSAGHAPEEAPLEGPLARVDTSGRPGDDGYDGANGAPGVTPGDHGGAGHEAGPASRGRPAASIGVVLESVAGRPHEARIRGNGGGELDGVFGFERAGSVELRARGGKGGNGGRGGDGGSGATGHSGSDATRYSSGSDGGRGGDGGDAGAGTSGADGGPGGTIVVRVAERDTHLLMLAACDVRGGKRGLAGQHGSPGAGGSGGRGGSSYTWTEEERSTDSNGNTTTSTSYHSNSGGSSGPSGNAGRRVTSELRPGNKGADGTVRFEVMDESGDTKSYPERYAMKLVSFTHRNENDDGIYEPEERVFVSRIEVENVGGMPTPRDHDVELRVAPSRPVRPRA